MKQTPIHEGHNPDLLEMIPADTRRVIEVGCSSGALARAFKQTGDAHWVGVEIDPAYAEVAEQHCDYLEVENIEHCDSDFYMKYADRDCWVFGDCLEHLQDPWQVLSSIRAVIPRDGTVVACIPNAQHWSLVIKQALGAFFYEDSGLLDRTHLRWFSRLTMTQLFESQGFKITTLKPRIFDEPARETFLPSIHHIAQTAGVDPETVLRDSLPLQYVLCANPA